jgi:hypothetical protein
VEHPSFSQQPYPGADPTGPGTARPRSSRKTLVVGLVLGIGAIITVAVVGLILLGLAFERQQVDAVEEALATLAEGGPLPAHLACADPDDIVRSWIDAPGSWPVDSYEVLGVSDLTPITPGSLWYVDVIVNGESWLVEIWDSDAGRMAGVCGIEPAHGP